MNVLQTLVRSLQISEMPEIQAKADFDRLEKTLVVYQTKASEVTEVLRKMKCKKCFGEDGITIEVTKCCSPFV